MNGASKMTIATTATLPIHQAFMRIIVDPFREHSRTLATRHILGFRRMTAEADLEHAVRLLQPWRHELRVVGPATPAEIEDAEAALAVAFPLSYRGFLAELGAGSILGREIYGVVRDRSAAGPPGVVWMNLARRRQVALPSHLIVVADLDDSSAFALDLSGNGSDAESPVVRIWPGEPPNTLVDSEVAPSFGSFFLQFAQERIRIRAD
jgi:SMI1-KNR4 cell-wall